MLLAEKLDLEDEMEKLRAKVANVEETIMADWDSDRIEQSHLREKLNDIASDVSRLVYALEGNGPVDEEESLFDRVQQFVDAEAEGERPVRGPNARKGNQREGSGRVGPTEGGAAGTTQGALTELVGLLADHRDLADHFADSCRRRCARWSSRRAL